MELSGFDLRILNYLLIIKLILFQYDVFLFGHGYHAPLEFSDFDQHFLELQISSIVHLTKFVVPKSVDGNQKNPREHGKHARIKNVILKQNKILVNLC